MKVYSIDVDADNNQEYEDYRNWSYTYKLLMTKESAEKYVTDEEKILELIKKDEAIYHEFSKDVPLQFEKIDSRPGYCRFAVWRYLCRLELDENGNTIKKFEPMERPEYPYTCCYFDIHVVEKEVEEE